MSAGERPLFQRLKRLRREAADASAGRREPAPEAGAPEGVPDWLRARLGRARAAHVAPDDLAPARAGVTHGPPERLAVEDGPLGPCATRVERRAEHERHGAWPLGAGRGLAPAAFAPFARDGSLARVELERAVFLDIETTGLSGGAGTYPFLIALGRFTADGFEVWQGFLREPGEERALLAAAAERIAAAQCVVSFFGKSFDRHRLEDKMRLYRVPPPFEGRPHLDLYHPCARLYRDALPDGRLQTMERALCGVARQGDLSGAFAPEAWFDFQAGRAHRLEEVFRHNLADVLSLVTLAAHVGRVAHERDPEGAPLQGSGVARAVGLARLARDRGDDAEALRWLDRAVERGDARRATRALRADALRRLGRDDEAVSEHEAIAAGGEDELAVLALCALAKHAEHKRKDVARALALCARARSVLERRCTGAAYARLARELGAREARLARKAARPCAAEDPR